jgi:multiple sugar transport system ATP-binding protein
MNVFPVKVETTAKTISFHIDGTTRLTYPTADLSKDVIQALSHNQTITLGIRPHALHIGKGPISGPVVACQWLGDQTHVAVEVAGRIVVSVAHDRIIERPGHSLRLNVAADDLHLFDTATGQAIAHGANLA